MFFTLSTILMITIFLVFFSIRKVDIGKLESEALRIELTNNLVKTIENNMKNAVRVSTTRATQALLDEISSTGDITDPVSKYKELIINGTLDGNPSPFMQNATLKEWIDMVKKDTEKFNINVNFSEITENDIEIYQKDPWHITISLTFDMKVKDILETASWDKRETKITEVSIQNFKDPLYLKNGITNIIKKNPEVVTCDNLQTHVDNYYNASTYAPSFLMRLEGKTSSSDYGIESFYNPGACYYFDYLYFGSPGTTSCSYGSINFCGIKSENHLKAYCDEVSCFMQEEA